MKKEKEEKKKLFLLNEKEKEKIAMIFETKDELIVDPSELN